MTDVFVHARMKRCCRETLKKLDAARGHLAASRRRGSLHESLSNLTIPAAQARVAGVTGGAAGRAAGTTGSDAKLEALVVQTCREICVSHAEVHEGQGEETEGAFWRFLHGVREAFTESLDRGPPPDPMGLGPGTGMDVGPLDAFGAMNEMAGVQNRIEAMGMWRRAADDMQRDWTALKPGETLRGFFNVTSTGGFVQSVDWSHYREDLGTDTFSMPYERTMDQESYDANQAVQREGARMLGAPAKSGGP